MASPTHTDGLAGWEIEEIDRANDSGKQPVMFAHGRGCCRAAGSHGGTTSRHAASSLSPQAGRTTRPLSSRLTRTLRSSRTRWCSRSPTTTWRRSPA